MAREKFFKDENFQNYNSILSHWIFPSIWCFLRRPSTIQLLKILLSICYFLSRESSTCVYFRFEYSRAYVIFFAGQAVYIHFEYSWAYAIFLARQAVYICLEYSRTHAHFSGSSQYFCLLFSRESCFLFWVSFSKGLLSLKTSFFCEIISYWCFSFLSFTNHIQHAQHWGKGIISQLGTRVSLQWRNRVLYSEKIGVLRQRGKGVLWQWERGYLDSGQKGYYCTRYHWVCAYTLVYI